MLKVLIVSDKDFYRVEEDYYSYGGTPKEFNYLSKITDLYLLVSVKPAKNPPSGYEKLQTGIKVFSLGEIKYFHSFPPVRALLRSILNTYRLCKKEKFQVVVGKGPREVGMAAILGANLAGIPSIFHYSYNWIPDLPEESYSILKRVFLKFYRNLIWAYRRKFMSMIARKAIRVATVSEDFKEHLSKECSLEKSRISLLPTTFTLTERYFTISPVQKGTKVKNILFVGRLDSNKNVATLLGAAKELRTRSNSFTLTIAGDGPEILNLKEMAKSLNLDDVVEFKGYVSNDNVPDILKASWCLVLPSFSEGLPKVLQEAAAAARPVIASRVGGVSQIVIDGLSGILFDPKKPKELAEKLEFLLCNEEAAINFGNKGREIAAVFSAARALENWGKVLNEVSISTK